MVSERVLGLRSPVAHDDEDGPISVWRSEDSFGRRWRFPAASPSAMCRGSGPCFARNCAEDYGLLAISLPSDLRVLLIDLDGVLYVEDEPVAGAVDAVAALRASGRTLRFVTNTTSRPRRLILERLERLGFATAADELVTPAALAVRHCEDRGHRRVALVMNDALREDFAGLTEGVERVDAVIVGDCGEAFDYATLNRAFRQLMDGAELVALQKNRSWLTPDGISLDVGPFVAALEYGARAEAFVVGKPSPAFFATALAGTGAEAARAAMVGDDVESDVGGALRAGMAGILVRTGKFREDALDASGVRPTAVIDSIAALPSLLPALC